MKFTITLFFVVLSFNLFCQVDIIDKLEVIEGKVTLESVKRAIPEIVFETPQGESFYNNDIIPYLVKAIKELSNGGVLPDYEVTGGNITYYIKPKKVNKDGKEKKKKQ